MKMMRALIIGGTVFAAVAQLQAQSVSFLFVTKRVNYTQTSAAQPSSPNAAAYEFFANIDGTLLSNSYPAVANTVSTPGGSVTSPVTLSFAGGNWQYSNAGYANPGALNSAFADGTYTFSINNGGAGNTVNLSMASDLYPNTPFATISTNSALGFSWVGNKLLVDPTLFTTLTVTTNTFATNFASGGLNHIGISGNNFSSNVSGESFSDVDGVFSLNVSAASFVAGNQYDMTIEFNNIITNLMNNPAAGIQSVSAFTAQTSFTIQAIPEPSTYAAIAGALALVGVMIHRRRNAAVG